MYNIVGAALLSFSLGFELNCTVNADRIPMVRCEGVSGVINDSEVDCIYDDGLMREMCQYNVLSC